ncbi:MAG: L,D-transpeptidase family protein [Eubacteriales bacterium]|nr:L,D-transpeptidase family protein [Eubacteriales bacterium]
MNRQKKTFLKRIVLPFTVCCTATVTMAALFCHAAFLTGAVAAEPQTSNAGEAAKKTVEQAASQAEQQVQQSDSNVQEIDGIEWVIHEELPIQEPSLSPEEATDVSILVEKSKHLLTLYSGETVIAQYTVGLASQYTEGPKQQEGDKRNPEGEYEVCVLNENSKYYLALGLNYPNAADAQRGLDTGLITQEEYNDIMYQLSVGQQPNWYTKLGGQIMIHGQKGNLGGQTDWTTGCVAVNNAVMDILWKYCPVGTKVTIVA